MSNYTVTCPKCQHHFEPTDAIREEVEKELRGKMTDWQKRKKKRPINCWRNKKQITN